MWRRDTCRLVLEISCSVKARQRWAELACLGVVSTAVFGTLVPADVGGAAASAAAATNAYLLIFCSW